MQIQRLAFLSPQIIFVVARVDPYLAIADFKHARGQLIDEIAVVRHEHDRAGEFLQRFQQDILGPHIQVIGGLIQQQKIAGVKQHPRQRVAVALAAR